MEEKVLIIDDDQIDKKQFENRIKNRMNLKYEVLKADHEDYLRVIETNENIIVIFLDIEMPKGEDSGLGIAKIIMEKYPIIPVIIYTAYPLEKYMTECINIGVDGFISKSRFLEMDDIEIRARIEIAKRKAEDRSYLSSQLALYKSKDYHKSSSDLKNVFIIHGHDEVSMLKLQNMITDKFKLKPVILKEEAWAGKTIIEKFIEIAMTCSFAFALLTPDDLIAVESKDSGKIEYQIKYKEARPNVVFEIGWFYGFIGRERTVLLKRKGTELPSDLNGIGYIEFDDVESVFLKIEKELKKANMIK